MTKNHSGPGPLANTEADAVFEKYLASSRKITMITGAGVSVSAGIPDFKSADHDWPYQVPRLQMMSKTYFERDPAQFWKMWFEVFTPEKILLANPTPFHRWAAHLAAQTDLCLVTQNIDRLHQHAGNESVIEAHGRGDFAICAYAPCSMEARMPAALAPGIETEMGYPLCPRCDSPMRPMVTLFGEPIADITPAVDHMMSGSRMLIVAGTRLNVSPVNNIAYYAKDRTAQFYVWINPDGPPTHFTPHYTWLGTADSFAERFKIR